MHRTQVLLEPGQHRALSEIARSEGRSISELLRELIREQLVRRQQVADERRRRQLEALDRIRQHRIDKRARVGEKLEDVHRWDVKDRTLLHHLDRFLDASTALRFHFGEVLLSALARAGVILIIGFPLSSILAFETLVLMAAIFHHSDLRLPAGLEAALSRLIITPAIHWVHHHRRRVDTDANYGTIFSFWDRLFRSTTAMRRRIDMAIGVEGEDELRLPGLLLRPFRRTSNVTTPSGNPRPPSVGAG